jgi:transposase
LAANGVRRVWVFDAGRCGVRVGLRKRWCPCGVRPPGVVHDRYEWLWLYAAGAPATGPSVCLLLPRVTTAGVAAFLAAFAREGGDDRVGPVRAGSGAHRAAIPWPDHLVPLPRPRYRPELTPAAQVCRVLRPKLANPIFPTLAALEAAITEHLRPSWDQPARLQRLTGYPWSTTAADTMSRAP